MQVLDAQIAGIERLTQFNVIVRHIAVIGALIHHQGPTLTVVAGKNAVLVIDVIGAIVLHSLVVIEVELQGTHLAHATQVHHHPFIITAAGSTPVGAHALIGETGCRQGTVTGRHGAGFIVGKQHPARKTVGRIFDIAVGIPARIIAESRNAIHHAIGIERRGIKPHAPFKLVFEREHAGAHMPVVAFQVGKGAPMTDALHKSTWFVTHGVVLLIGEGTQRVVAHIDTVGIHLELGARCTILEVISAVMLGHERPFHERFECHLVIVVHPEALPSMLVGLQEHQVVNLADRCEIFAANLNTLDRVFVA